MRWQRNLLVDIAEILSNIALPGFYTICSFLNKGSRHSTPARWQRLNKVEVFSPVEVCKAAKIAGLNALKKKS